MSSAEQLHPDLPSPQEAAHAEVQQAETGEFEYHLLTGHYRTDGSYKTTEQLQTEYLRLTDDLVHKITDGVLVTDQRTREISKEKVDVVVWLDKSARPVSWLMRDAWPLLAQDAEGNVPEEPQHKFVNIDRNQWVSSIDPELNGVSRIDKLDRSIIRSLRSVFLSNPKDRAHGLDESIDTAPTQLDGKTVLIVDEVRSSGKTLDYATQFFYRAFPEAKIAGAYWMEGMATSGKGLSVGNSDLPVWYRDDTPYGRGVNNRNIDLSRDSENTAQRLGAWFLSVGFRKGYADELSVRLRNELHQLVEDAKEGKVLIEPSRDRDDDDYDERATRLNHTTWSEYTKRLHELKAARRK